MSLYSIEYHKAIVIYNPTPNRDPLPMGDLTVQCYYMEEALKESGMELHQFEPLQVTDRVGFLKTGDEAAELLLDALQEKVKKVVANGGGWASLQDIIDAMDEYEYDDATQQP